MTRREQTRRPARLLPGLALLFLTAGGLHLASGLGAALAQDPAPSPGAVAEAPAAPVAERTEPASPWEGADLSIEIRERERAVSERESALAAREASLLDLEERLRQQVTALQSAEAELEATMALADRAAEDDIARLVSVFEAMKAEDAIRVFGEMEPGFAAGFLARLTPATAAGILGGLEPRLAYALSAHIAGRNALVPQD